MSDSLDRLYQAVIAARDMDPSLSRTARLFREGHAKMAKKLAEEAVEVALAAAQRDQAAVIAESADLIYHWLALLAGAGVTLDDVAAALEAREGRSGIEEKAGRGS